MQFVRKNPLAIAFFILILGPTLLLSFFSFRNILNEGYLAQKNFEEDRLDLKKAIEKAVEDEENEFLQEYFSTVVLKVRAQRPAAAAQPGSHEKDRTSAPKMQCPAAFSRDVQVQAPYTLKRC